MGNISSIKAIDYFNPCTETFRTDSFKKLSLALRVAIVFAAATAALLLFLPGLALGRFLVRKHQREQPPLSSMAPSYVSPAASSPLPDQQEIKMKDSESSLNLGIDLTTLDNPEINLLLKEAGLNAESTRKILVAAKQAFEETLKSREIATGEAILHSLENRQIVVKLEKTNELAVFIEVCKLTGGLQSDVSKFLKLGSSSNFRVLKSPTDQRRGANGIANEFQKLSHIHREGQVPGIIATPQQIRIKSTDQIWADYEYYNLGSLDSYLPYGATDQSRHGLDTLSLKHRFQLARQLLGVSILLKREGIVHGDIHPRNVLLRRNSHHEVEVALADFGSPMFLKTSQNEALDLVELDVTRLPPNKLGPTPKSGTGITRKEAFQAIEDKDQETYNKWQFQRDLIGLTKLAIMLVANRTHNAELKFSNKVIETYPNLRDQVSAMLQKLLQPHEAPLIDRMDCETAVKEFDHLLALMEAEDKKRIAAEIPIST